MNKLNLTLVSVIGSFACITGNKAEVISPIENSNPSPSTRMDIMQSLGSNLLDCRIRRSRMICNYMPEDCGKSREEITKDEIFERIKLRTPENEFDILIEVQEKLKVCEENFSK